MSTQLKSEKAKQIYNKIEMKRQELRRSMSSVRDSVADLKVTAEEAKHHPMALLFPKVNKSTNQYVNKGRDTIHRYPFSTIVGALGLGYLAGSLLLDKPETRQNLTNSIYSLWKKASNNSFSNRIWNKIMRVGEEAIDDALGLAETKESPGYLPHEEEAYPDKQYHNGAAHS